MSNETVTTVATEKKHRGRPVIEGSSRQMRLQARAARIEQNGGLLKRGRPTVQTSARQQKLADKAAKLAAGIQLKPGRPKMVKVEEAVA